MSLYLDARMCSDEGSSGRIASVAQEQAGPVEPKPRKRREVVAVACTHCKKAGRKCSNSRPCDRCIRRGLSDCVDRPQRGAVGAKRSPLSHRSNSSSVPMPSAPATEPDFSSPPPQYSANAVSSISGGSSSLSFLPLSTYGNFCADHRRSRIPHSPIDHRSFCQPATFPIHPPWPDMPSFLSSTPRYRAIQPASEASGGQSVVTRRVSKIRSTILRLA